MYADYWGLVEIPFKNTLDTRWFYESPGHDEALARLIFLVEQHRRCGVLSGLSGTGKSLILELLRRETVRTGAEVALVDVLGLGSRELLWEILAALGRSAGIDDSPHRLWRRVQDHIRANGDARVPLALILDHLDRAQPDCLVAVERLQHLSAGAHSGLTLVLGVGNDRAAGQAEVFRDISDLRIEVVPLDRGQTQQYVETLLERAGADRPLFDAPAFDRLFDETRGIPRQINRLCDLALLAGMADQVPRIGEPIIATVADELHVRAPADRNLVHFRERFVAGI
jgi:general secretion pathway protein A